MGRKEIVRQNIGDINKNQIEILELNNIITLNSTSLVDPIINY